MEEKLEDDPPSIDRRVGDTNRLVIVAERWPRRTASAPRDVMR